MSEQELPVKNLPGKEAETEDGGSRPGKSDQQAAEYGGPKGKEPTRYGDWEKNGRCIDF